MNESLFEWGKLLERDGREEAGKKATMGSWRGNGNEGEQNEHEERTWGQILVKPADPFHYTCL